MLSTDEIKQFMELLKKLDDDAKDIDGEGDEPDSDKQVDLFPEPPTEVITDPGMRDTEFKLPKNVEDDGGTKLREAHYIRKLARKVRRRLRKDYADGVVPLRNPALTKEQNKLFQRQA